MSPATERKALSEGLLRLNENMRTLAELAELAIRKAVASLEQGDAAGATDVFALDSEIYALKQETIRSCVELIALHAPVAQDLRTVTASLEITTDLDRIGRYSKDIAEITQQLNGAGREHLKTLGNLTKMGDLTIEMIHTALDAFVDHRAEPVRNIIEADDAVDQLHEEVFSDVVEQMANRSVPPIVGAQYILVNRYFERLADHAVNIGEHVTYMVTGTRPTRVKRPKPASAPSTS